MPYQNDHLRSEVKTSKEVNENGTRKKIDAFVITYCNVYLNESLGVV